MQTERSPTTFRERLKNRLSQTISKLKLSTTQPTTTENIDNGHRVADSQDAEADAGPPTLRFNPAWSNEFHVTLPTGADLASWEPYDITSTHPPSSLNHPIYSELGCWRRKSEGQYTAHNGKSLLTKWLIDEHAALQERNRDLEIELESSQDHVNRLKWKNWHLTKLNKLPRTKQVRRYLQLCHLYQVKKKDVEGLREEVAGLEARVEEWRVWCAGREEVISTLLCEKQKLRERCWCAGMGRRVEVKVERQCRACDAVAEDGSEGEQEEV